MSELPSCYARPADLAELNSGYSVAVTGATGFIGARLVEMLLEQGVRVRALTRKLPPSSVSNELLEWREVDLRRTSDVESAVAGTRAFYHCAHDFLDESWNLHVADQLCRACRADGDYRLVYLSSYVVYLSPRQGALNEDAPIVSAEGHGYAQTKRRVEIRLSQAWRERGLATCVLQPTIVYGPRSRSWIDEPADMLWHGRVVVPDDAGVCNALYVDDLVKAMLRASVVAATAGRTYLISGPDVVSWPDFYQAIASTLRVLGPETIGAVDLAKENASLRKFMRLGPEGLLRRAARDGQVRSLAQAIIDRMPDSARSEWRNRILDSATARPGFRHIPNSAHAAFLSTASVVSCAKAHTDFGYEAKTPFGQGMQLTAEYLRSRYH